jgi:hypothetical protein
VAQEFVGTGELRGATFTRVDLSGCTFRDVDLSGARITDALLVDFDVSGLIVGMKVNGVEVAPLVEAELDRRHPERVALRPTDPDGFREGWAVVESLWRPVVVLAEQLPDSVRRARIDGEWSLVETLRHLVFVTDAWFRWAVLGASDAFDRGGLAPTFLADALEGLGIDRHAAPTFDEVLAVREERMAGVRTFLTTCDQGDLDAGRGGNAASAYPPPGAQTVADCLRVVMDEEWNHLQYAVRDLAVLRPDLF